MTMLVGFLMFSISTSVVNAIELQRPSNPSCTDTATCDVKARRYFSLILKQTEGLENSTDAAEICPRLRNVYWLYQSLKRVDFSLLSVPVLHQTRAFYYLFAIGNINVPTLNFCGLQESEGKAGDFNYIRSPIRNLVHDASAGLKEITP